MDYDWSVNMIKGRAVKILEKTMMSTTQGTAQSQATSSRGIFMTTNKATASTTVRTDHTYNIIAEDLDTQEEFNFKIKNQEFNVVQGKDTAVMFLDSEPVMYLPSKKSPVQPLNSMNNALEKTSFFPFLAIFFISIIPFINMILYFSNLFNNIAYYDEEGNFKTWNLKKESIIAFLVCAFTFAISFQLYLVMAVILGAVYTHIAYKKEVKQQEIKSKLYHTIAARIEMLREKI